MCLFPFARQNEEMKRITCKKRTPANSYCTSELNWESSRTLHLKICISGMRAIFARSSRFDVFTILRMQTKQNITSQKNAHNRKSLRTVGNHELQYSQNNAELS